jgi:hypothetical protein
VAKVRFEDADPETRSAVRAEARRRGYEPIGNWRCDRCGRDFSFSDALIEDDEPHCPYEDCPMPSDGWDTVRPVQAVS